MGNFRGWEWILVLALALLLFGGFKKMPDAARGIGRSLRIFKAETKGLVDHDDEKTNGADSAPVPPVAPPAAVEAAPKQTSTAAQSPAPASQPATAPQPAVAPQQDATNSAGPA